MLIDCVGVGPVKSRTVAASAGGDDVTIRHRPAKSVGVCVVAGVVSKAAIVRAQGRRMRSIDIMVSRPAPTNSGEAE
jgi:hypothetical protein